MLDFRIYARLTQALKQGHCGFCFSTGRAVCCDQLRSSCTGKIDSRPLQGFPISSSPSSDALFPHELDTFLCFIYQDSEQFFHSQTFWLLFFHNTLPNAFVLMPCLLMCHTHSMTDFFVAQLQPTLAKENKTNWTATKYQLQTSTGSMNTTVITFIVWEAKLWSVCTRTNNQSVISVCGEESLKFTFSSF